MTNRTTLICALLVMVCALVSCKKDDPAVHEQLIGVWDTDFTAADEADSKGAYNRVLNEGEKNYFPPSSHTLYAFDDNGTLSIKDGSTINLEYQWVLSSDNSRIRTADASTPVSYHYYRIHTLTANGLILEDTVSGRLNWVGMKRQ